MTVTITKAETKKAVRTLDEQVGKAHDAVWELIQSHDLDPVSGNGEAINSRFDLDLNSLRQHLEEARTVLGKLRDGLKAGGRQYTKGAGNRR